MSIENFHVVVGLGATGLSCIKFLSEQKIPVAITDNRPNPPGLTFLNENFPEVVVSLGEFNEILLDQAETIVLSPGVSIHEPVIEKQIQQGKRVVGDIEIFAQYVNAPVVAITGSNAKSTVTTLVGLMAEKSGLKVKVGGNLGTPALDLLDLKSPPDLYVLELSSFQLETTYNLNSRVACVLNVTPDHMDRYQTFNDYWEAKLKIYNHCQIAVCNRDDPHTECGKNYSLRRFYFTGQEPVQNEFGLTQKDNINYLSFENELLMPTHELPIRGRHYQMNALAAMAIGHSLGLEHAAMIEVLREFKGLAHRCQLVREMHGISWYNDSKGTNVGATIAAIQGLGSELKGKLILIAGGVGKNADFMSLVPAIQKHVRTVILIGESAQTIAASIGGECEIIFADDMKQAIHQAEHKAHPGDAVLLSPACASFDMFKNFEHRGEVFTQLVEELAV